MNLPIVFHVGKLQIEAHLVFELLSYFIGFQYYQHLKRKQGDIIDSEKRLKVVIGGILGAAIGSKLLGLLEHPHLFSFFEENIAYLFSSKTIVGGLIGGILGVEFTKKLLGISHSTGDLFTFPLILGMIIGRIGCFLAGAGDGTWGVQTGFITGINGGDGMLRHPTPLYEIIVLLILWLALAMLKLRTGLQAGSLFKLFMVAYFTWRFAVEFIKPVHVLEPVGLSAIQLACIAGVLYYHKVILRVRELRAS